MPSTAQDIEHPCERIVNVMLTDIRVTMSFRAALFAAAAQSGMTVSAFVMQCAAEKLSAEGAHFAGVFAEGDLKAKPGIDPFAGDDHRVALDIGSNFVRAGELAAFELHKPKGTGFHAWAVDLMREKVLSNVRKAA